MKNVLRQHVRGIYDLQQLRIMIGNRITTNFRTKLGQEPGKKTEPTAKKVIELVMLAYSRLADGITDGTLDGVKKVLQESPENNGVISDVVEFELAHNYKLLTDQEARAEKHLEEILEDYPIYTEFLKPSVKGCGVKMAAVIISEIDIHKAQYPSSLYRYAGLDVADDGRGRGRYEEHLRDIEYIDKHGEVKTKKGITYNPFLKTKLMGVLAPSFLKSKNPKYDSAYRDYKYRLENHVDHKKKTKGHRDNMAKRYMIKLFLNDLYRAWRKLEGLTVYEPYPEAKLGMVHSKAA